MSPVDRVSVHIHTLSRSQEGGRDHAAPPLFYLKIFHVLDRLKTKFDLEITPLVVAVVWVETVEGSVVTELDIMYSTGISQ